MVVVLVIMKYPGGLTKRKDLFWHTVLKVPAHDWPTCFGTLWQECVVEENCSLHSQEAEGEKEEEAGVSQSASKVCPS